MADVKKVLQVTGDQIDKALLPITRERYSGRYAQSDGQGGLKFVDSGGGGGGGVTKEYVDQQDQSTLAAAKQYTDTHGGGGGGADFLMVTFTREGTVDGKTTVAPDTTLDNIIGKMESGTPVFGQVAGEQAATRNVFLAVKKSGEISAIFTRPLESGTGIERIAVSYRTGKGTLETIPFPSGGSGGYVAPEDYGAVGDGIADDTAAIQKAVNSGKPVRGYGKYKTTSTISLKNSIHLREVVNANKVAAIVADDLSNIEIKVDNLTAGGTGIKVGAKTKFTEHVTVRVGNVNAADTGIKFWSTTSGIQYCDVYIGGAVRGDSNAAFELSAEGASSWVGEIKTFGGELRSTSGYGISAHAVGDQRITALRCTATSLEECAKGILLDNVDNVTIAACRREKADKITLRNKCQHIRISGYMTYLDNLDISGYVNPSAGTDPGIFIDEPVSIKGQRIANCYGARIIFKDKVKVEPVPLYGRVDNLPGTDRSPVEILNDGRILTHPVAPDGAHIKLTQYHGLFGIKSFVLEATGKVNIYDYNNKLLLSVPKSGTYEIRVINDWGGWVATKLGEPAV